VTFEDAPREENRGLTHLPGVHSLQTIQETAIIAESRRSQEEETETDVELPQLGLLVPRGGILLWCVADVVGAGLEVHGSFLFVCGRRHDEVLGVWRIC
jgi:hypothetical protein